MRFQKISIALLTMCITSAVAAEAANPAKSKPINGVTVEAAKKKTKPGRAAAGADENGVTYYYNGTPDGSITSTYVNRPAKGYTLTVNAPAFSKGYAGINCPQLTDTPNNFNLNLFVRFGFEYTPSPDPLAKLTDTPGMLVPFLHTTDGYWHTVPGNIATCQASGPGSDYTMSYLSAHRIQFYPLITNIWPADQFDLIFTGGSDKPITSMTIGNLLLRAESGGTGDFEPRTFATTGPDLLFNHQYAAP